MLPDLSEPDKKIDLNMSSYTSIAEDPAGGRWIGAYDGGFVKIDTPEGSGPNLGIPRFTRHFPKPGDEDRDTHKMVRCLLQDEAVIVWIGTSGCGLYRFEPQTGEFKQYLHDAGDSMTLTGNKIYAFYEAPSDPGVLWIGTETGLSRFEIPTGRVTRFLADPADPLSLSIDFITAIHEDRSGSLWIGTVGGGLNRLDRATGTFACFDLSQGLSSRSIAGILEDDHGRLWFSTFSGIACFDPEIETIRVFNTREGLSSDEFCTGAQYKGLSGTMYFGSIGGLTAFKSDEITENEDPPAVVLTDFQLFNDPVPIGEMEDGRILLRQSITATREIELSYSDSVMSFHYAALHFAAPEKNLFAYIMEGFDRDWNVVHARRLAT